MGQVERKAVRVAREAQTPRILARLAQQNEARSRPRWWLQIHGTQKEKEKQVSWRKTLFNNCFGKRHRASGYLDINEH